MMQAMHGKDMLTLCHYPMMRWINDRGNESRKVKGYMVHGHIHNRTGDHYFPLIHANPYVLNAGVDINDYRPVTFNELIKNNRKYKNSVRIAGNRSSMADWDVSAVRQKTLEWEEKELLPHLPI